MFDFLNFKLSPKVVCQTPATDNYEVENLISEVYSNRMRGFIVYPAIKPPVEIEFIFICPVNIHYISLNSTVGSQKCAGIEIFATNDNFNYKSICKSIYDKPGIVFCNSKKYSHSNLPDNFNTNFHLGFFKSNTFKYFLNASAIKVVIFRTEKSVPCLGSVEVWGTPSRFCSEVTIQTVNRIMTKHSLPICSQKNTESTIPEDFKDALTCEIMSVPMTLPSGKTIDQSTLDKHVQSEISFKRKPGDPFTGIKFTDKLKPVLNVALKSRIDMFILQNSHRKEFNNVKRTLGRAPTSSNSNSGESNSKKCKPNVEILDLEEAISKAQQCPNFTSFTSQINAKNVCVKCEKPFDFLYEIPCHHFHCRTCLLDIRIDLKCSFCFATFSNSDVKKHNL